MHCAGALCCKATPFLGGKQDMIYIESALDSLSFNCVVGFSSAWGLKPDWKYEPEVASKMGASEDQVTTWCESCVSSELECARICLVDGAAAYNGGGRGCRCYTRPVSITGTGWNFCTNTGSTSSRSPPPSLGVDVFVRMKPSSTCMPCPEKETSVLSPSGRRQCTCEPGLIRSASSVSKDWTRSCGPSQNSTCNTRSGGDGSRRWWMVDLETHRSVVQLKIQACKHESCWSRIFGLKLALRNASQFDANMFPCYTKSSQDHEATREFTASCIGTARFVFLWVGTVDPTIAHPRPFNDIPDSPMVFVRSALQGNLQVSHMSLDDVQVGYCHYIQTLCICFSNNFSK